MRVVFRLFLFLNLLWGTCAQAYVVHDSRGDHQLEQVPQRVVVLDWNLLEAVIELGVTPLGTADMDGYADWMVKPEIPTQTVELGNRSEPNLEKIVALKPDVILVSERHVDIIPQLERIAPVFYFSNFAADDNDAQVAIEQLRQLGELFQRSEIAEQKLAQIEQRLDELKGLLQQRFDGQLPPVVLMRFANLTSTFLYTENSIPQYVLERLGLTNALPQPTAQWGIVQKPIADLQHIKQGMVLYILPFNQEAQLKKSILWKAMPFVRNRHVGAVSSVWSYGGAISIQYMAEAITDTLVQIADQTS